MELMQLAGSQAGSTQGTIGDNQVSSALNFSFDSVISE